MKYIKIKIILALLVFSTMGFSQESEYDISFTGVQWENVNGMIINPNGNTGCKSIIYYSQLVQVAGGGNGIPGSSFYYFADGGAIVNISATNAVLLATPTGSFSQYFTWTLDTNTNTIMGVQNQDIPLNVDPDDPLNGINGGRVVIPVETPNIQNQGYAVAAVVSHQTPAVYNSSMDADEESATGQNNDDCILPIKLSDFSATKFGAKAALKWNSTEEIEASYYEIQRTGDISNFKYGIRGNEEGIDFLNKVSVKGSRNEYAYFDNSPLVGLNYYRLKMVDIDGTFEYSAVRSLEFVPSESKAYPNPFINDFNVALDGQNQELKIYTSTGALVKTVNTKNVNNVKIDMEEYKVGIYFVEIIGEDKSVTKRFKLIKVAN